MVLIGDAAAARQAGTHFVARVAAAEGAPFFTRHQSSTWFSTSQLGLPHAHYRRVGMDDTRKNAVAYSRTEGKNVFSDISSRPAWLRPSCGTFILNEDMIEEQVIFVSRNATGP